MLSASVCSVELINNLSPYSNHLVAKESQHHRLHICTASADTYEEGFRQNMLCNQSTDHCNTDVTSGAKLKLSVIDRLYSLFHRQMKCHVFIGRQLCFQLGCITVMLKEMTILHCIWLWERCQKN